jgi:AcrR family transcriptional regulator
MTTLKKLDKLRDKSTNRLINRAETRSELAGHAITALSQLGYARTGMRDIAQLSNRSVGALTYYFDDKIDLICYCVRMYKKAFIAEIDLAIDHGVQTGDVAQSIAKAFSQSIANSAETHRLWYDIRSQALFEKSFREVVSEIEENLLTLMARILKGFVVSPSELKSNYFILDGLFRLALQEHLNGNIHASSELEKNIVDLFSSLKKNRLGAI